MTNSIYATFTDPEMATKAAGALLDHGVRAEHISIIFHEGYQAKGDDKVKSGTDLERGAEKGITTTTAGDATSGAAKGAGIGLAAGTLAALAAIFVPGVGLIVGGGALATAIGGAAATTAAGALAGGATGFLKDQGVPQEAVEHYTKTLDSGGAVMNISPTDEKISSEAIYDILAKYQGVTSYRSSSETAAVRVDETRYLG